MKKLLTSLLLASALLVSCGDTQVESTLDRAYEHNSFMGGPMHIQTDGRFLYYQGYGENSLIYRLNPQTGRILCLCTDPLCEHDTPYCRIFGVGPFGFYLSGDQIYFRRSAWYKDEVKGERVQVNDLVCYDITDDRLRVSEEYETGLVGHTYLTQLFSDEYRFFYENTYDEETQTGSFALCREERSSGKIVRFEGEDEWVADRPCFTLDGRIYFTDGERLYSRTFDNTDEQTHCTGKLGVYDTDRVLSDGSAAYFNLQDGDKTTVYRLPDLNDYSSAVPIIDDCFSWYLTENYIYYIDSGERNLGKARISGYSADEIILHGKEIRRCAHDGSNDESVFKLEGEYEGFELFSLTILGDNIYCFFRTWNDLDGDGVFRDGESENSSISRVLCIDTSTGTAEIILK